MNLYSTELQTWPGQAHNPSDEQPDAARWLALAGAQGADMGSKK
jgi:hypothetical protein